MDPSAQYDNASAPIEVASAQIYGLSAQLRISSAQYDNASSHIEVACARIIGLSAQLRSPSAHFRISTK